jgi:hypothetical protein
MAITFGTSSSSSTEVINIDAFLYERNASTLVEPVPAGARDHDVLFWENPHYLQKNVIIYALGSDQHEDSYYHWYIDGVEIDALSGPARFGSIEFPFVLPKPVRVRRSIRLAVDNNNSKPYPNPDAMVPADLIPYEGVVYGLWEGV